MATPVGLSCTLPPSCFTFFSLCSFRLYLDSVWFASARCCSGPERPSRSYPPHPASAGCPSFAGPSSAPRPVSGAPRLSATRVYIGLGWWGSRQNDKQVKVPARHPPPGAQTRHFDSRGKRRTEDSARTHVERAGSPRRKARSQKKRGSAEKTERKRKRESSHVLEDLSKQNPNLSSSHVLRREREKGREAGAEEERREQKKKHCGWRERTIVGRGRLGRTRRATGDIALPVFLAINWEKVTFLHFDPRPRGYPSPQCGSKSK